jgi:leucyl aminopeptidase
MNINLSKKNIEDINSDIEIVIIKNKKLLDKKIKNILENICLFDESNKTYFDVENKKLYVSCLKLKDESLKIAFSTAINEIKKYDLKTIKLAIVQENKELNISNIIEGLVLGSYEFNKYKSKKEERVIEEITISIEKANTDKKDLQKQFEESLIVCNSVNYTRDIVNTAPEDYYPETMANDAIEIGKNKNVTCTIYDENYLLKNGMNAMYNVGLASRHESKLIHLTYKHKNPKAKIVLVGKGVTYDTGGLSLKRGDGMVSMKCDKGGAASILGIIRTLAKLELPIEVHAIAGAVENMIGGDAYKPGDILKASNGKTIEVTNTDAEGRLVLADCLHFAQKNIKDFDYIFDFATLTGASIGAFGGYTTAVMGFNDKLKNKILKASKQSGELVGFLPFNDYMANLLKSETADFVNTSPNKNGGAITASLFLSKFIEDKNKKKWLHFDIAGPSYRKERWGVNPYGATGVAIRMMIKFMEEVIKKR